MKHLPLLLVCLLLLVIPTALAEDTMVIAVTSQYDAMLFPAEEAFFETHPDATIEYRLYTQDQLNMMMMTGTADFDLLLSPYQELYAMEQGGYLASVSQVMGQTGYPEQLIDLSHLLMKDGELFALPVSVYQFFWAWNVDVAEKAGIDYPCPDGVWTWEDYAALSDQFPMDTDADGQADLWLKEGSSLVDYPAFSNVDTDLFETYVAQYTDFEKFGQEYLDLFKKLLMNNSLLSMDDFGNMQDNCNHVLIANYAASNPIYYMEEQTDKDIVITVEGESVWRFLPIPVLDKNDVSYQGILTACAMVKNPKHPDLAADFLSAMLSPKAMDYGVFARDEQLVGKELPKKLYLNDGSLSPVFQEEDGVTRYCVRAGRNMPTTYGSIYTEEAYNAAQAYRELLSMDMILAGRDFYDAAWAYFQEWYFGRMDDAALCDAMGYLFGLAAGGS